MYENAQPVLDRILDLVKSCPEKLQEKCFEVLLNGYVAASQAPPTRPMTKEAGGGQQEKDKEQREPAPVGGIPDAIRPKLTNLAARQKVPLDKAAGLFDFNTDPFTFHAYVAPGTSKAEKCRNVALLLALKGYLISGNWLADWKEFRASCIDQNCFDTTNFSKYMNHAWFKHASPTEGVALKPVGITAAEALFVKLAGGAGE